MKKYILLLSLLLICLIGTAQTYTSNKLSMWSFKNDKLTIFDESGNQLITIESSFTKHRKLKKKIKTFSVNNQTHFITKEAKGIQLVYTENWKLIARITKNGEEIIFPNTQEIYKKKVNNKWFGNNGLKYLDVQGNEIAFIKRGKTRRVEYVNQSNKKTDFILMALSAHQLQEKERKEKENEALFQLLTE